MAHPSPAQSISTPETTFSVPLRPNAIPRSRTLSLLSISSGASVGSVFEITKGEATVIVSQRPEKHEAWGSFIPLRSATTSLREFIPVSPHTKQSTPKRRRTSSFDIRTPISSNWVDNKRSSQKVPYITRTLPSSPICPPSPTSSSSSVINQNIQADLHPVLAQLEKKSKLCAQKVYCSTCKKPGTDFPRCGKCGEMWCSRSCRLIGGKRHVCSSRA